MIILLVILLIGGFFGVAILLALAVIATQNKAKKEAQRMVDTGDIDKVEARKILKTLSTCKDNEGKRLYNKLADLVAELSLTF